MLDRACEIWYNVPASQPLHGASFSICAGPLPAVSTSGLASTNYDAQDAAGFRVPGGKQVCGSSFRVKDNRADSARACSAVCGRECVRRIRQTKREAAMAGLAPRACACGCGGMIEPMLHHRFRGVPLFIHGHNSRAIPREEYLRRARITAKKRPNRIVHSGYVLLKRPGHILANKQGYVPEHRLVMEAHLGRPLLPEEVVHHENGDTQDNRVENLQVFRNQGAHLSYHERRRAVDRTPAERSSHAQKTWANMTAAQRAERCRKAWDTRRKKAEEPA